MIYCICNENNSLQAKSVEAGKCHSAAIVVVYLLYYIVIFCFVLYCRQSQWKRGSFTQWPLLCKARSTPGVLTHRCGCVCVSV